MLISKERLLAATGRELVKVPVPELGDGNEGAHVLIRTLTAGEKDRWEESRIKRRGKSRDTNYRHFRASLVALCVVGEDGKPYFTEEDVETLDHLQARVIDRIFMAAKRLSGVDEEDEDFFCGKSEKTAA